MALSGLHRTVLSKCGLTVLDKELPLISRLLTSAYNIHVGNHDLAIFSPPDTDRISRYGGFDIRYHHLAITGEGKQGYGD